MNNKKLVILLLFIIPGVSFLANAQNYQITGKIFDKQNNTPLVGVSVILTGTKDSTIRSYDISDDGGNFTLNAAHKQAYKVSATYLGYQKIEKIIVVQKNIENLGQLFMSPKSQEIKEVIITGQAPAAVQKGDTTEMDANAYKTTKDATAEDLVQKMPTVSIDNSGNVKAQGENVQKVLVDGKPFFGDDPTIALRNLPAEVIDKVQIYNELSDQAKLTGFDDGNTTKTMNIVTKKNNRNGVFGKLYAGYGTDEDYQAGENLNFFDGDRRISVISMSNNINQQNFSAQDLLGLSGGSSGRGNFGGGPSGGGSGGGNQNFLIGQQSGISKTNSIGLNYSDNWGSKIIVTSSYFFNNSNNNLKQDIYQKDFTNKLEFNNANDTSTTMNYNNRFNIRFEYDIDSMNTLILVPKLSFQRNISTDTTNTTNKNDQNESKMNNLNNTNAFGYNLSSNLTFRHKFIKKGRTISLSLTTSENYKYPKVQTETDSVDRKTDSLKMYTNQNQNNLTKGYSVSSNIMYTEPIGKISLLQINYNNSVTHTEAELLTKNLLISGNPIDTSLSNTYNSNYITNSAGLGYRLRTTGFNGSFTINYQVAQLDGSTEFPAKSSINRSFKNWMPMAFIRFRFSDKDNISVIYRATTTPPSISQLQSVVNNTNQPNLSIGNPNLNQQYSHNLISRISFANPEKSTNFFAFINASYTLDPIGTSQSNHDTIINGIFGKTLSKPINFDHSWQFNTFLNYGFPLHFMKSNLNFNAGVSYSQTPGKINNEMNYSNNLGISPGAVLSSNVSENLDFTVLYFGGYNFVKTTINPTNNNNYYSHSAGLKFSWIFWKGIVWTNNVTNQYYKGLSSNSYNQDYILWNMGLGKKLFANQRGEIKLNVYDLLNQNTVISQSVNGNYIQDTRTNALKRYFMLTFTYNLRQFQGNANDHRKSDNPQFDRPQHDHPPFGGPPPGGDSF
jgi:hypothetical protein